MKSERGKKTRRSRKKEERKGGKKRKFLRGERKVFVEMIGFVALVDNHGFIGIVVYTGCRIHRRNFSNFSSVVCDVY